MTRVCKLDRSRGGCTSTHEECNGPIYSGRNGSVEKKNIYIYPALKRQGTSCRCVFYFFFIFHFQLALILSFPLRLVLSFGFVCLSARDGSILLFIVRRSSFDAVPWLQRLLVARVYPQPTRRCGTMRRLLMPSDQLICLCSGSAQLSSAIATLAIAC